MEGESESFWLEEAAVLEQLIVNAQRMRALGIEQESRRVAA
jgi:hypothetical protein